MTLGLLPADLARAATCPEWASKELLSFP